MGKVKPVVLWDLDGVLCDFISEFAKVSRGLFKKPGSDFVQTAFNFEHCGVWGPREVKQILARIKGTRNFWTQCAKYADTNGLMHHYKATNSFFATARFQTDGADTATQSAEWLYRNFAISDAFVICNSDKAAVAKELDADYAIDDKAENVLAIVKTMPKCKVYLMDRPYNQSVNHPRIKRVATVNKFLEDIIDVSE